MLTAAFAAETALQMVFFGKNKVSFRAIIEIFGVKFLPEHRESAPLFSPLYGAAN
jgi:hypothetical protein